MGFLSKLFGSKTVPPTQWHSLEGAEGVFVTLSSAGLSSFGQREVVFTLRAESRDTLAPAVAEVPLFLQTVEQLAQAGRIVSAGGFTQFGARGLFGQGGNGVLYLDAAPMPGVALPPNALAAVVLDPSELALAQTGFKRRVLTRRGQRHRYYPFPLWTDVPLTASRPEESLVLAVSRAEAPGVSAVLEGKKLCVSMDPSARDLAADASSAPFTFLTGWPPNANAHLVWSPGQAGPEAITPRGADGSKICGAFLVVSGGAKERDEARVVEDGFALVLTDATLERFWKAVADGEPLSLDCRPLTFELVW